MEERRQSVRINESLRVSYQVVKSFRMVTSYSKDVSVGGVCMPILQRLKVGLKLDMEIYLDTSDKPIKAIGEIVWAKPIKDLRFPFVAGIKFLKISPESANRLRIYIKKNSSTDSIQWIEKD